MGAVAQYYRGWLRGPEDSVVSELVATMEGEPENLGTNKNVKGGCMRIVIQNDAHREFIEEQRDFRVADHLKLKYCGLCAAFDNLTLVPDDAPVHRFHHFTGTTQCLDLPVCDQCLEQVGQELEDWLLQQPGIERCLDGGCIAAGEDLREIRALKKDTLFYGYEAYPTAHNGPVTMKEDTHWLDTLRPAGDIWAFATEVERDAWVEERPTLIKNRVRLRRSVPLAQRHCHEDWQENVCAG